MLIWARKGLEQKNIKNDKRTHFEKHKYEHKPIKNKQLQKLAPDRPKKNEPIFVRPSEALAKEGKPIFPVAAKLHA
jgi:hypothetical protein